jgi:hypothetical protein
MVDIRSAVVLVPAGRMPVAAVVAAVVVVLELVLVHMHSLVVDSPAGTSRHPTGKCWLLFQIVTNYLLTDGTAGTLIGSSAWLTGNTIGYRRCSTGANWRWWRWCRLIIDGLWWWWWWWWRSGCKCDCR